MTKSTGTGYLRSHTRAANKPAESPLDRLANAVIGRVVARDADQAQAFRDAQAGAMLLLGLVVKIEAAEKGRP